MPQDIAQATLELAAARFRAAEHIGLASKSIGGQETIAYDFQRDSVACACDVATVFTGRGLMASIALDGLDETRARLDAMPAALSAALAAKANELASALVDRIKYDKLSGGALNVQSGALQASITAKVSADADGVSASIGSDGDVKYAAIQEYGGKTSAHEILPQKSKALAFMVGGSLRFAKSVHHPGSLIPARPYLGSALDEMSDEIVTGLASAVEDLERA